MHCFITGTNTDVGKTYVTCLMLRALRAAGRRAVGYKPVCCGSAEDIADLHAAGDPDASVSEIGPVILQAACAPYVAARLENRVISLPDLVAGFERLADRFEHVLVEGAGGWEVPLAPGATIADLAETLGLPVLVVVDNRLGALNHTILTVNAIRERGLTCAGLVLNHLQDERDTAAITNRAILEEWLEVPVLQDILFEETETSADWILDLLGV